MFNFIVLFFILSSHFLFSLDEKERLEKQYIETMAQTFQGLEKEGSDRIWPRFYLTDRPIAFHFQNKHVYLFGLKLNSPLWKERLIHDLSVLFCPHYPDSLPPLQPAFPIEGKATFLVSLDHGNDTPYLPLVTFIHERFHFYQFRFFKKEKIVEPKLSDYLDEELLAWIELEQHLLISFLKGKDEETKLECLKNYLAISHVRRQSLHPDSLKWEDHQQKMEGLADYVSIKTFEVFPFIPNFNAEEFLLKMRQKKNSSLVNPQDAMKGRHYFVGAVLGWALDFSGVKNWKLRIEREEISLQEILEQILLLSDEERRERSLQLQTALDWKGICGKIKQKMEIERKEKEKIFQIFARQEGIVIKMGTPSGSMSAGGSHQKSYHSALQKIFIEDTSVAMSQDQTWTLRFNGIPLVFEEQNGDRFFKLNYQTLLRVNGEDHSLYDILQQDQKELSFSSLSLKHEHCELDSQRPGKLFVEEGAILFKFF